MGRAVWRQVLATTSASMTCMSIGIAYGWSSPVLPKLLGADSIIPMTPDEGSWVPVCIEAGSLITSLPAGWFIDKYGRKFSLLLLCPVLILSWLLIIFTKSVLLLYVSKLIQGSCLGVVMCATPLYIAEISQPHLRGTLSAIVITMWYIGFILAFTIGSYTSYNVNAYISLGLSTLYVIPFSFQPESPYFHVMNKNVNKAVKSLSYFRNAKPSELCEEMKVIEEYIKEEKQNKASFLTLFQDPISLRCLLIMEVLVCSVIFTGMTYTLCYATEIFSKTSSGLFSPEQYSIAISVLFLIVNLVPAVLMDKVGRRVLVLVSCAGCFVSTLSAAVFFYIHAKTSIDVTSLHWVPFVVVGGYCTFICVGLNPLANTFQGELFPAKTKSVAAGVIAFSFGLTSSSCLKMYFLIDTHIGLYFNYLLFSMFAATGGVILYFYMPETKDKTFVEIQRDLNRRYNKNRDKDNELMKPINK